jgi:hypothetical protein
MELTDEQWARIEPLRPPKRQGRGRPRADDRAVLNGILVDVQIRGWCEADRASQGGFDALSPGRAGLRQVHGLQSRWQAARPCGFGALKPWWQGQAAVGAWFVDTAVGGESTMERDSMRLLERLEQAGLMPAPRSGPFDRG